MLWIALRDLPGIGPRLARELCRRFGGPEQIFAAPRRSLVGLIGERLAAGILRGPDLGAARDEARRARGLGIRVLGLDSPEYPGRLREIADPPVALQVRGPLDLSRAVAIVGSRRPSPAAREMARALGQTCADAGVSVVSGLAYGIDAAAHAGTLDGRGTTVAVLASGADRASPEGQRALAQRLLEAGGAWISEHPPGTPPAPHHFPARNRLISGLVPLCVIVEARERSGSLWTARHAVDQARDVAVVPGPVGSDRCRGSNRLLRDGAAALLDPEDLIHELDLTPTRPLVEPSVPTACPGSPEPGSSEPRSSEPRSSEPRSSEPGSSEPGSSERGLALLRALADGPADLDRVARKLGLLPGELQAVLLELELEGRVMRQGSAVVLRRTRRP